jgi:hypothetical protein
MGRKATRNLSPGSKAPEENIRGGVEYPFACKIVLDRVKKIK